jgi:general stress protein 26
MSDLKQRIFDLTKELQLANLATITEDGKPRVRYMVGKADAGLTLRFCSALDSGKVRHIRKNPTVSVTLGAKDLMSAKNWLQIEGTAEISTTKAERDAFWFDGLKKYFKSPDDPNYCVIIIKPSRIELGTMASMAPEVWLPGCDA